MHNADQKVRRTKRRQVMTTEDFNVESLRIVRGARIRSEDLAKLYRNENSLASAKNEQRDTIRLLSQHGI
jgi:hypothetical protein